MSESELLQLLRYVDAQIDTAASQANNALRAKTLETALIDVRRHLAAVKADGAFRRAV